MGVKEPCSPHGWTVDTLETHLSSRIDAVEKLVNEREERSKERSLAADKAVSAALSAADKALTKAEMASEKRFDSVNEFRQVLSDQASLLLPRQEYNVQHQALEEKVEQLTHRVSGFLPVAAFESQIKGILDRFDALNNLITTNSSRVTSIEVSLRTKKESTSSSISVMLVVATIGSAVIGAVAGHFFK